MNITVNIITPNEIRGTLIISGTCANQLAIKLGITRQAIYLTIDGKRKALWIREAIAKAINKPVSEIWPEPPTQDAAT